ncbi:MAG: alkaline phosphatase D family protein [Acidimicrobiia bacterium]|nr:alkaline phosphatase D family protein [Acidimicrobiia bacterium]
MGAESVVPGGTRVGRRDFMRLLAASGGAGVAGIAAGSARRVSGLSTDPDAAATFTHGVMCGDPAPDGAVIWTRVQPVEGSQDVTLVWEVAEDTTFEHVVAGGSVEATTGSDHTAHVRVAGLNADGRFFYRFHADGSTSRTGCLRTAPAPGSSPDHLRLVFSSCQQRTRGTHYVSHTAIVAEEADFLVHLGDYIYVSDTGTLGVDDYRDVHRTFKSNPLLQDCHAALPCVTVWDDGEFHNGFDRTADAVRTAAARQAWFEYMPVMRDPAEPDRIHRTLPWGDLADIFLLDLRSYRDRAVDNVSSLHRAGAQMHAPDRRLLGDAQMDWLRHGLGTSGAAWHLIGQQYMIMPWRLLDLDAPWIRKLNAKLPRNAGIYAPTEDWDDYQADRKRLLGFLGQEGVENVVFMSGDLHLFFAGTLHEDYDTPMSPTVAFDFCTGSLTADPDPRTLLEPLPRDMAERLIHWAEDWTLAQNPYMAFTDLLNQGYVVVDVTPEETLVTFRTVDTFDPDAAAVTSARFRVGAGADRIERL